MATTTSVTTAHSLFATLRFAAHALVRPAEIVRGYRLADLRPDMVAGLTVAVILLPQAIAYALIADLPPAVGLYTAIVAAIVGALWGSSSHLQTGPTNAASLLVLSTLAVLPFAHTSAAYVAAASLMALMVGLFRMGMGVLRLGILVNFVSDSVIVGFTAGAGVLIMFNQLKHLLRIDVPNDPGLIETARQVALNLGWTHPPSLVIGVGVVLLLAVLRRFRPNWPGPLIAMVLSAAAVWALGLEPIGVKVIGLLPQALPPLTIPPIWDLHLIGQLSSGALAVAAIGLVEAMSIARSISAQTGQRINSNQEFIGQGLANVACGLFSGYTCSGSFTRSAVNYRAGARTAVSSVFSGVFVLLAMLVFAPFAAYVPRAALAGVLLFIAYGMIDRKTMVRIWRTSRPEGLIMVATLAATLLLPLEFAVLTGILISLAYYVFDKSMPRVIDVLPTDDFRHFEHQPQKAPCVQLSSTSIVGDLYFGAAPHIEEILRQHLNRQGGQRYLLLRLHNVSHIDISGVRMLESVVRAYRERGGDVFLMKAKASVHEFMDGAGFGGYIGEDHFLPEETAISHIFYRVMDPVVCIYECPARPFIECQNLPKQPLPAALVELPHGRIGVIGAVTPKDLWAELHGAGSKPLLIDVREPREHERGHVPGTVLLPLSRFTVNEITAARDHPIVLICRTGRRSQVAAQVLAAAGFTNLRNLDGGMVAWEESGLLEAVATF